MYMFFIVCLGILQVTFLDYFSVFGVKPDLLLIAVVTVSLLAETRGALVLSIFAGALKDMLGVGGFGTNTFFFCLWSFLILQLSKKLTIETDAIRAIVVFVITLFQQIISGLLLIYSGSFVPLGIFLRITILETVYTTALFPLLFKISTPNFAQPYPVQSENAQNQDY